MSSWGPRLRLRTRKTNDRECNSNAILYDILAYNSNM